MSDVKTPSVARLAVDTIKEAKKAGEELGRIITDMQADNERQIRQYHNKVIRERREARQHDQDLDQRALDEWLAEQAREKNKLEVRAEVERTYGRGSWEKIEAAKARMLQIEAEDKRVADELRHKMDDLFWWCLGAAALITYAFKLYK
jgi:hypothetical protein